MNLPLPSLTHSLTPWNRVLLFPAFYGTRRFITVFTSPKPAPYKSISPVRGFLCESFVTRYVFTVRNCSHLAQHPNWKTTPYRLSTTSYSIYSHLPSILDVVPPSANWRRAMPWWRGPTYHGFGFQEAYRFLISYNPPLPERWISTRKIGWKVCHKHYFVTHFTFWVQQFRLRSTITKPTQKCTCM
jgi:hypothetical protein